MSRFFQFVPSPPGPRSRQSLDPFWGGPQGRDTEEREDGGGEEAPAAPPRPGTPLPPPLPSAEGQRIATRNSIDWYERPRDPGLANDQAARDELIMEAICNFQELPRPGYRREAGGGGERGTPSPSSLLIRPGAPASHLPPNAQAPPGSLLLSCPPAAAAAAPEQGKRSSTPQTPLLHPFRHLPTASPFRPHLTV